MKNILLLLTFIGGVFNVDAQLGTISTYASYGTWDVGTDKVGNVYAANYGNVYKFDSAGGMISVAGGGSTYGDGGPATAAALISANNVVFDAYGNMYISDGGHYTIRKVDTAGTITTVAGNYALGIGYTGDGGPATAARINAYRVCLDRAGNMYISDQANYVIRKVNTAGVITTVAGNGSAGFSGDGGPATSAQLDDIWGIATDHYGNLYIGDRSGHRIRKVNSAGTISTYAGNGTPGTAGIGGPASAANLNDPWGIATDAIGNLYISEWGNSRVSMVNTAGILNVVAGGPYSGYAGDGGPATAARLDAASDVSVDPYGNLYIADANNYVIRKVSTAYLSATHVADSFGVFIHELCGGPVLDFATHSYSSTQSIKCYYGDGTTDSSAIVPGYSGGGYLSFTHAYSLAGTYTIKTILLDGGTLVDSLSYSYEFKFCNSLSAQYYYDGNGDCAFDSGETTVSAPILTEVDSNGVAIDTLSAIGGFYYTAYGTPGDVYQFRILGAPTGLTYTCPSTGMISDTLGTVVYGLPTQAIGFSCTSTTCFDLEVLPVCRYTGRHAQIGDVIVKNNFCNPVSATVSLTFDSGYAYHSSNFTPTSVSGNTVTWNFTGLYYYNPVNLNYHLEAPGAWLTAGSTTHTLLSIAPYSGDCDTSNNNHDDVDTVRGSWDPNLIEVAPGGHIAAGTNLTYTIHFENTGNDTALNIYVLDTLSNNVDAASLRMKESSVSKMYVSKLRDAAGHTIMKFDFPGINLLDSSHHGQCDAMFRYTINTLASLPECTNVPNRAGIYFDYNPVVMTNEAADVIGCLPLDASITPTLSGVMQLYPNPASDELLIKAEEGKFNSYTISNYIGATVFSGPVSGAQTKVNISSLPAGLYYVSMAGHKGNAVGRFVKI